jgi:glucose/arabinose dehydrogenase
MGAAGRQSYAQSPPAGFRIRESAGASQYAFDSLPRGPLPDCTARFYHLSLCPREPATFYGDCAQRDLLVSQPITGKVLLVRPNGGGAPLISDFTTGLAFPHDIVFHQIGTTTYVYITESHQINRYVYNSGDLTAHNRQIVVTGLPVASTPELNGTYRHRLKNIVLDDNHKLYVSIASSCNACSADSQSDPIRAAIYQYNADGTGRRLFAQGLRNAEGLAFVPGTNRLWAVVNNRDNIAYPFNRDFNGDGTTDYGKVLQSYVDNHPPEEFTYVQDGGNYGWPFCNPNPDNTLVNMPFDRDYEFNRNGQVDCNGMTRISRGIQAHSAPLGLTFLQSTSFANAYRAGAAVGMHGSWNRTKKTGYKVAFFSWNSATQTPTGQIDLVKGFLNEATQSVLGRPVDVAIDHQGDMLISDDHSNTIYKLSYLRSPENPASTVGGLNYSYYEGYWNVLPDFAGLTPVKTGTVTNFSLTPRNRSDHFAFRFTGYVQVPANGLYTFYTSSDDGSKFYIGNTLVVNNDGLHGIRERAGTIRLRAGKHALTVTFFEKTGGEVLNVSYAGPGIAKRAIPTTALFRAGTGARAVTGTSGEASTAEGSLRVRPNPGTDWIQVSFPAPEAAQVSLQLTDATGRNALSTARSVAAGMNQVDLFVGNLKRGTYTVTVGQKGKPLTGKVVLVR